MNAPQTLRFEEDVVVEIEEVEAKVFPRVIATPAAPPWDQIRSAHLDARLGAPLPLTEVIYRLKRLEPWALGRAGRFVAFYVRTREIGDRLDATVMVEGRPLEVSFLSGAEQTRRARKLALGAVVGALCVLPPAGAILAASAKRAEVAEQLDRAEQDGQRKVREARGVEQLKKQARALNAAGGQDRRMQTVLSDLAWASTAKVQSVKIEAVHWDRGYMAVEARGEDAPFQRADRLVKRFEKPVRRGVWLWGVAPKEKPRSSARPIAAVPLDESRSANSRGKGGL